MATGMKAWLTLALTGAAVLTVILLPPGAVERLLESDHRSVTVDPAVDRARQIGSERSRVVERITALELQSFVESALSDVPADEHLVIGSFPAVEADPEGAEGAEADRPVGVSKREADSVMARFRNAVIGEVPALSGPADGRPLIAFLLVDPESVGDFDRRTGATPMSGTLPDGRPYCADVEVEPLQRVRVHFGNRSRLQTATEITAFSESPLGFCHLWAEYGAPGPRISGWYSGGGNLYAQLHSVHVPSTKGLLYNGLYGWRNSSELPWVVACLGEERDGCGAVFTDPLAERRASSEDTEWKRRERDLRAYTDIALMSSDSRIPPPARAILFDLEREFGEERFRRFWTSDLDVEGAFQDAFGVSTDTWMRAWVERVLGEDGRGPTVVFADLGISLLLMLAAAAVVVRNVRKREV